jgi:hypothetical protein
VREIEEIQKMQMTFCLAILGFVSMVHGQYYGYGSGYGNTGLYSSLYGGYGGLTNGFYGGYGGLGGVYGSYGGLYGGGGLGSYGLGGTYGGYGSGLYNPFSVYGNGLYYGKRR